MSVESFTVLMCVYEKDNPKHFESALASIINQELMPTEIVIVQDGPVPSKIESCIGEVKSKFGNLKHIVLEMNRGHGEARNLGLQNCSYDLVAIADADDISKPHRFSIQVEKMTENLGLAATSSYLEEFSDDFVSGIKPVPISHLDILANVKWKCPMNQPAVMLRRGFVNNVGGYIHWYNNEDYYLWIRLLLAGYELENVPDLLVKFRVDNNTYKRRGGWKYFISEVKIQKFMSKNGLSSNFEFFLGVIIRFIVQIALPNFVRELFYKVFLRRKVDKNDVVSKI